ncbi:unnamed protein product [Brachionus calyciflorus]|uniref:SAM domain-containing protein n=1 Tax=Brachionus calyciflorus TaxID=104777 RepID=A0A813V1Q0_9BILA|nr:unnamed protein product [Brachionus calyciflorus]
MSTNSNNPNTPQKPASKIQQKPTNLYHLKPVNLNPSPNKPALIAARPLAPLLPATTQSVAIQSKPINPVKKAKNDNLLIQQTKLTQPSQLTQEQLNQIAAALQPKHTSAPLPSLTNGHFYQFIPIQSNGVKIPQPLIIAPVQPHKNSNIQPKPPQQTPIIHTTPDGQISQIFFQTVPNNTTPINSSSNQTSNHQITNQISSQSHPQPVQHQLNTTTNNIQLLQQRLAEEEQRQDQLLKQLNEKKKLQVKKSPEKKIHNDEMEIDETNDNEKHEKTDEHNLTTGSVTQTHTTTIQNKKRGRPRLYEIDASTGKSIKGKLLNNNYVKPQKTHKMVLQPQIQLPNGFAIYPSPSTSSSSSYSQQNSYIINPQSHQLVNPQFIPLSIVQPMVQEERNHDEENDNEDLEKNDAESSSTDRLEENSEKENLEQPSTKALSTTHTPKSAIQHQHPTHQPSQNQHENNQVQTHSETPVEPEPIIQTEPEPKKLIDTLKNLQSPVVLTHIIDGFVIKESSKPFPVKPVESDILVQQESPPKSTSTPSNNKKREDDLVDRFNNSRLLEDQSLLNTSNSSQKSKGKATNCNKNSPKKIKKSSKNEDESDEKSNILKNNHNNNTSNNSSSQIVQNQNYSFQNTSPQFNSTINNIKEEWPTGDPTEWNCDEVYRFVYQVAGQPVAEMFKSQDIDGSALNLIRDDHLVNTMGVKLGPALKIMSKFNELKIKFNQSL